MTDLETENRSTLNSDTTTNSLAASEANATVMDETPAVCAENASNTVEHVANNAETATDDSAHQSTGEALLAAIEEAVPSPVNETSNVTIQDTSDITSADTAQEENIPAEELAAGVTKTFVLPGIASVAEGLSETQAALITSIENSANADDDAPIINEVPTVKPEVPRITFAELNLDPRLQKGIDEQGFTHCTPIQSEALPHTLNDRDVIGKAQTGTGKTAAFLITIIQNLLTRPEQEERYNGEPRALILAPTRELALQIEKDARPLLKHTPLNMVSIVGGMDYKKQQKRLQEEIIDIVVGTPGRLIDFVRNKDLFFSETEVIVIDEADRMLDMGFIPDVKRLVRETPYKTYRQTLLFSATFTQDIMNLAENWTREAIRVEIEPESVASSSVDQKIYIVTAEKKINVLYNLITQQKLDRVMVFVNRRDETRDLTTRLKALGLRVAMLSGEIPQHKRLRTLENFRNGRLRVMVATDVAGRGIHIEGVSHVVNYTLPEDPEDYVHRIGRTGRAGATGTSVSFACEEDAFLIPAIEKLLGGGNVLCTHPEPELLAELPELIVE